MIAMAYILSLQGFVVWQIGTSDGDAAFGTTSSARQANAEEDLEGHRFSVKLCRLECPIVQRFDQWGNQLAIRSTLHGYLLQFPSDVHDRRCNDQLAGALRCKLGGKLGYLLQHRVRWRRCSPHAAGGAVARGASGWRLQQGILQGPGRSGVFVVGTHVEINGVHLLILKNAEVGKPAAAAGG